MHPPAPDPPSLGPVTPADIAAALVLQLAAHGITGVYTATTYKLAVISVTADLTVWADIRRLWCHHHGQQHAWPAADLAAAAAGIAALTCA
jgi:hypothetical protein